MESCIAYCSIKKEACENQATEYAEQGEALDSQSHDFPERWQN